jgi:hypothetical protein
MRKLLTITCCVGLASLVGAAQHDDQDGNKGKKKGQQQQQQQAVVAPQTGKKFKTGAGPHNPNFQQPNTVGNNQQMNKKGKNWQGQGNASSNASNTTFNKTKNVNVNKNLTVNKNFKYQKKQFNLQTNNKQFVVNKYKTVNYNANHKFVGFYGGNPNNWGSKYVVFANYHPLWHDTWWWNSHHNHLVFIFGGWYFWDSSYWYPAWGYASDSVYVYDGPIYASSPSEDPGQVVANVQSALQQQGFYQGDVDGVLGPQTRAALAEFQSAQGLQPAGAIDEPTLETLGMA